MKIFFIRHGETTGDVENRYGGDYDDHLSPKGVEQCQELAQELKEKGIEIIYTSSLIRAQETSEILKEQLGCEIKLEADLRERNQYGILTGMNKDEAREKHPTEVELLKDRLNTIEGAEPYEAFSERIQKVFADLVAQNQFSTIAIVSHGGPLRVLFRDILKWGELTQIGDCSFVELSYESGAFSWTNSARLVPDFQVHA